MFFLVASLILTIACSTITIRTLVAYTDMKFIYKLAISIAIILGWLSPVIVNFFRRQFALQGILYDILTYGGYFLFGMAFITFMISSLPYYIMDESVMRLIFTGLISIIVLAGSIYFLGLEKSERVLVFNKLCSIRKNFINK